MPIQKGIRTPGMYTDVNINTQRTGLPANTHKVLFVTPDAAVEELTSPVNIYNRNEADESFGLNSVMGRMITAAIQTNRLVDVQGFSASTQSQISCAGARSNIFFSPFDLSESSFEIELDGVIYGDGSGGIGYYINNHPVLSQVLDADQDGYLRVDNLDAQKFHRVRINFIGLLPASHKIGISNPPNTAYSIEHDDGAVKSISFCLAPVEPIGPLPQE